MVYTLQLFLPERRPHLPFQKLNPQKGFWAQSLSVSSTFQHPLSFLAAEQVSLCHLVHRAALLQIFSTNPLFHQLNVWVSSTTIIDPRLLNFYCWKFLRGFTQVSYRIALKLGLFGGFSCWGTRLQVSISSHHLKGIKKSMTSKQGLTLYMMVTRLSCSGFSTAVVLLFPSILAFSILESEKPRLCSHIREVGIALHFLKGVLCA